MKNKKLKMTSLEAQILSTLPLGYNVMVPPKKIKDLATLFNTSERAVYKAIESLIFNFDYPIVGLRYFPQGYFIATTENEFYECTAAYKKQISTEQKRLIKLKKNLKKFVKTVDKLN